MHQMRLPLLILLAALGLAACGAGRVSDADRIATEVALGRSVAQTLTADAGAPATASPAAAPSATPAPPPTAPPAPTPLPASSPTPLPTLEVITPTSPAAPSATPAPPTSAPQPSPTNTPSDLVPLPSETPSPTAVRVAEVVRVPGGSSNGVTGELRLRGLIDEPLAETPVVRGTLALRAVVRDPDAGPDDGDGVLSVSFFVLDPQGNVVYETVEENPAFCLSGGDEPGCALIDVGPGGAWPNGAPVTYGVHQVNMDIAAGADNTRGAFWFTFIDIQPPAGQ